MSPSLEKIHLRDKSAIAEALNLVENQRPAMQAEADALLAALEPAARNAHWVGITGPPGVGKSTLTSALIQILRQRGTSVAVVAVDPSSKKSGGALLGDRARIHYDAADSGVFVRSMAAGNQLGGLARATQAVAQVLAAAYDMVIVETVGVGQSETDIADLADTVLFIVQPGAGDALQFLKSGIMEIPDILVVNKADQDALARRAMQDIKGTLTYRDRSDGGWVPRVMRTSALNGEGVTELADAIAAHRQHFTAQQLAEMRALRARRWALAAFERMAGHLALEQAGGRSELEGQLAKQGPLGARAALQFLLGLPR